MTECKHHCNPLLLVLLFVAPLWADPGEGIGVGLTPVLRGLERTRLFWDYDKWNPDAGLKLGVTTRPRHLHLRLDWEQDGTIDINADDPQHLKLLGDHTIPEQAEETAHIQSNYVNPDGTRK